VFLIFLSLPPSWGSVNFIPAQVYTVFNTPDGRWLVVATGKPERLFLLDWRTGEMMSHHALWGCVTSGLAFDPTSTFVAGVSGHENWGHLMLWSLTPAERWSPHMEGRPHELDLEPDEIHGPYALHPDHWELDRTGVAWPTYDLADTGGTTVFSPDSRLVVFRLISYYNHPFIEFLAYEVASGKPRWCIRRESEDGLGECFTFTPDGRHLLICGRNNDLSVYSADDGTLQSRFPPGCHEPIEALAFDYDGRTLWLATEEALFPYHLQGV
jgi:WD40 repeat protein